MKKLSIMMLTLLIALCQVGCTINTQDDVEKVKEEKIEIDASKYVEIVDVDMSKYKNEYKKIDVKSVEFSNIVGTGEFDRWQKQIINEVKNGAELRKGYREADPNFDEEKIEVVAKITEGQKDNIYTLRYEIETQDEMGPVFNVKTICIDLDSKAVISTANALESLGCDLDEVSERIYKEFGKQFNGFENFYIEKEPGIPNDSIKVSEEYVNKKDKYLEKIHSKLDLLKVSIEKNGKVQILFDLYDAESITGFAKGIGGSIHYQTADITDLVD